MQNNIKQFPANRQQDSAISAMTKQHQGLNVDECLNYIRKKASVLAEAKASRAYLPELRKCKKSMPMLDAETTHGITVFGKQENYAHPEYIDLLQGLRVAIEQEAAIALRIKSVELKLDLYRTEQANLRAEKNA
ncbi:hypothetical protein [Dasania marina]|uniref:hypothetical protein n=1 Tax=Dasania marina TaxID=471499 RepID=UPI0030DB83C4|tara:strand:+ start:6316 stop:6717 length:402 start_codon:yes stop_codon:yes gene_type:complete